MSVVGIDFGTLNTVIAVARNRGVDVITNEVSNRATPSIVGFGPKSRYLGEPAKTQEISNLKNTVGSLKRLIGRKFSDEDTQIEQDFVSAQLCDVNNQVGAEVTYAGSKQKFNATQLVAMLLTKIKQTASNELKPTPVSDVVISCPPWYTDIQRRAMLDAAEIAGLKVLRLMNDTTAAALGYGITKTDLPTGEEKPRIVAFVDLGYSDYTCSIVQYRKGELTVLATTFDRHLGGRNFDKALIDHLAQEFKAKYKIDILSHAKAKVRVASAVEKLKKILSANQQAPLNIESLMNDIDVSHMITRQEFEEMIQPLLQRIVPPLEQALADAGLTKDDIDVVELVGGATRVPSVKESVQSFFGKQLSFTLNQDEAIARGCAFSCAQLSPIFQVRAFTVHDITPYAIEFTWEKAPDIPDEDTSLTVFTKNNMMPSTKILTFYRKQPFDLEARYADPSVLPGKVSPWIGHFAVKNVHADERDDFMICKLKTRINIHGILSVESGYYVEEQEIEEEIKEESAQKEERDPDAMETDEQEGASKPRTRIVKKQIRKGELPITSGTTSLDSAAMNTALEKEIAMAMEDKLVADTEEKKNELESYIYDMRNKLEDQYSKHASDDEKSKIQSKLTSTEDWLYDEGEDATKAVYISKMEDIKALAGPIVQRYWDEVNEQKAKRDAELQAKRAAEEEARKARQTSGGDKTTDGNAKDDKVEAQPEVEEME